MKLAALAAALLLAPSVAAAPPRPPEVVAVAVGHERATGFVAGDGRVVTVAHVLGGGEPVPGDNTILVAGRRAVVLRVDRGNDLALLRVEGVVGDARFGSGDRTTILGRPGPIVRRMTARVDGGPPRAAMEVRAEVTAGDSGAPLITPAGRVAGVVFARSRARARTAYAVDASAVVALLR